MRQPKLTTREKEVLKEYDELFIEMYSKILESLESKTVNELQEIRSCFEKVGETNCAWTTYAVKGIVLPDLQWILKEKKMESEVKQMPKAILKLEMPANCWDCPLQAISTEKKIRYCTVIRYSTDYYRTKRRENCPLKPVDDKEVES